MHEDINKGIEEKKLIEKLYTKMGAFQKKVGAKDFINWQQKCFAIIREKYPDPLIRQQYRLYHFLQLGSGYENEPNFDFPGECSIQKMIEELPE